MQKSKQKTNVLVVKTWYRVHSSSGNASAGVVYSIIITLFEYYYYIFFSTSSALHGGVFMRSPQTEVSFYSGAEILSAITHTKHILLMGAQLSYATVCKKDEDIIIHKIVDCT